MDYLDELRAEGQFDSAGAFTLGYQACRRQYANLAKSDKAGPWRMAIQAMVASGSPCLKIDTSSRFLYFRGAPAWSDKELDNVYRFLEGGEDAHLQSSLQYAKLALLFASCRSDLICRLQLPGSRRALKISGSGPEWEQSKDTPELVRWTFEGTRAIDPQEWIESRIMNLFGNDWPELSELSEHLAWLPTVTTVNGKPLDIDYRVTEATALPIVKVAIIHPEAARNQIRFEKGPVPLWKRWVPEVPLLCFDPTGQLLETPPEDRFLAHCSLRFFRQAINLREQDLGVTQRFRLLKNGIPLDIPQANFPQRLLVSLEASDLKTDITGRTPIRDQAFDARVQEVQTMLVTACQGAEEAIAKQKFWLSFNQSSCLESLAQIRQSIARGFKL